MDAGSVFMTAQEVIGKLQQTVTSLETSSSALAVSNPAVKPAAVSLLPNLGDILPSESISAQVKPSMSFPNSLKVEKQSDTLILVSWDGPTAPLSFNQSIDSDNIVMDNTSDQVISVQTYNVFLNHELLMAVNGIDERVAVLNNVDLSIVSFRICF